MIRSATCDPHCPGRGKFDSGNRGEPKLSDVGLVSDVEGRSKECDDGL